MGTVVGEVLVVAVVVEEGVGTIFVTVVVTDH